MHRMILIALVFVLLGSISACGRTAPSPEAGQNLAVLKGCAACHSVDATPKIGPSWVGLYGSQVELANGSFVTADEAYLIESIKDPNIKITKGYTRGSMPDIALSEDELGDLLAYIISVK